MSVVLPLPLPPRSPHHYPLSRSSTPGTTTPSSPNRHSRPSTPPPLSPVSHLSSMAAISAPTTPVTTTHIFPHLDSTGMERCHSSEAVLGRPSPLTFGGSGHEMIKERSRDGRRRDVKATSLLFKSVPSLEQIQAAERENSLPLTETPETVSKDWVHVNRNENELEREEKMDVDHEDAQEVHMDVMNETGVVGVELGEPLDSQPTVWGMASWGREEERKEVRRGVRLVGMEELPALVDRHSMLDVPSHILFPWLHGICDDGHKGREMAGFFGHAPPFEPPPYRGLCLFLSPPHPLDEVPDKPKAKKSEIESPAQPSMEMPPRERSETMSTSSESYHSSAGTTEGTSPSLSSWKDPNSPTLDNVSSSLPPSPQSSIGPITPVNPETDTADVVMHPIESKRISHEAVAKGFDQPHHPLPCATPGCSSCTETPQHDERASDTSSIIGDDEDEEEEEKPSCILLNALHVRDVFDLPRFDGSPGFSKPRPRFRPAKLPPQINLRNLHIQQIKYATISDVILYSKSGVGNGVLEVAEMLAQAQEDLWQQRMDEYYSHVIRGEGEGLNQPVRYGVWVVVEPFHKVEKHCPHLVTLDSRGNLTMNSPNIDLFEREAYESRAMTKGSEVVERFWVGNDCDVPGGADDGAGSRVTFDLCVRASECCEMPTTTALATTLRKLQDLDRRRHPDDSAPSSSWTASPATMALRQLLSPSPQPSTPAPTSDHSNKRLASPSASHDNDRQQRSRLENEYVSLECSGSCRTITGQMRNLTLMTDKIVELVYFLRKVIEGKDGKGRPSRRRILVHCQDGYTESSILVLSYIMSSLSISLPEAYLHLQNNAKRSFFLYTSDKPLLRRIDARLAADRKRQALKLVHPSKDHSNSPPASPTSSVHSVSSLTQGVTRSAARWKSWGMGLGSGNTRSGSTPESHVSVDKDKSSEGMGSPPATATASFSTATQPNTTAIPTTVEAASNLLMEEEAGGSEAALKAKVWFDDRRFDGFPSRILPFLYLGNLEHAGNAAMLHALGISHVVSVGESLVGDSFINSTYGGYGGNTLAAEERAGRLQVLDLNDVRDDGNDPLRPLIAKACAWIENARQNGGSVLVHCRVGVSRSASIVIAYMMLHQRMGLMDAYLVTRARRLNVLIQPNLRFFHELFGWEVELARRDEQEAKQRRIEAEKAGVRDPQALAMLDLQYRRRIVYSWPSFCRDVHCLNRRFLCQ